MSGQVLFLARGVQLNMPDRFGGATWMLWVFVILAAAGVVRAETLVIDAFDYPTAGAAQEAWKPLEGSPPIGLTARRGDGGGRAGVFHCDWGRIKERIYYDRSVELDLGGFGRITLWVYTDRPDQLRGGTLYFQSGEGWYAGWFRLNRKGWQQVAMDRHEFGEEGSPAGWHDIQTVRLSFWKAPGAAARDVTVAVDCIEAHSVPIVVVRGDLTIRSGSPEADSVRRYAANMGRLLGRGGVEFMVVNDTDVERGALAWAKLAIFPYNPHMSEREVGAVRAFIAGGGRVMVFYTIPRLLAEMRGILASLPR